MGAEQSNNNNSSRPQTPQMSQAEMRRILEAQRRQYEKKCQEMVEKAAAQNAKQTAAAVASLERERTPYQYSRDGLHNVIRDSNMQRPLYPNLNEACSSSGNVLASNFQQNCNPFRDNSQPLRNNSNPFRQSQDFVFVDNYGQSDRFRAAPSAPPAPSVPSPRGPRTRSVSGTRHVPKKERDVMDCPTCGARYGMKIFQCNNGHSSCSDCKFRGLVCGICRLSLTDRRNYEIENLNAQMKVPCTNSSDGCKLYIKMADMEIHAKECPFKEQECPLAKVFGNCHWRGKLNQLSSHFDNMHQSQRQTKVDTEMQLMNICNNSQQVHLVVLGFFNFLFHLKVSEIDRSIYMTVQLIGTKMSAERWLYEIHVFNKNENRRKYMFTDNCSSSSESVDDIFKERNCAVLPVSYASSFVNNGALAFKFFIKKTEEGRKDFLKNSRGRGRGREDSPDLQEKREWRRPRELSTQRGDQTTRQWVNSKHR